MRLLQRAVDSSSGDDKFDRIVDSSKGVTRRLQLKVQPTMIDRYDVAVVLKTLLVTLKAIDDKENGRLGISGLRGDFAGEEDGDLWEILRQIEDRLASRCSGHDGRTPATGCGR